MLVHSPGNRDAPGAADPAAACWYGSATSRRSPCAKLSKGSAACQHITPGAAILHGEPACVLFAKLTNVGCQRTYVPSYGLYASAEFTLKFFCSDFDGNPACEFL